MALDGSFCLHSEYNRFLARCPKLGSIPKFAALSVKGGLLTEEEVVNSAAELFLHPNYTIPLLGCFRPISAKIVKKSVALLRLVPNLRSDMDVAEKVDEIPGRGENSSDLEVTGIIEYYVRRGRGLYLHELACLAFCRSVDLAPFLMGSVLSYFEFAPPPFQRILTMQLDIMLLIKSAAQILDTARTSYRLLLMEQEIFSRLWNWSCFLDLVGQLAKDVFDNDDAFSSNILDLRWCGMQILRVILKFNDTQPGNKSLGDKESLSCLLRMFHWYLEPVAENIVDVNRNFDFSYENCLQSVSLDSLPVSPSQLLKTEPSASKRRPDSWGEFDGGSPFILTSSLKKSFEIVFLAVHQKWPVLLYGPAGAGKTALIHKLAQGTGNRVLSIHVDDQIDTKTLVGSYVCTEQPGEFRWQPGSLTQAILNGLWVVFEDIDKAPMDMQSVLLPLLEGTNSFTPGHGEAIRVAEGFRMFSTITSSKTNVFRGTQDKNLLGVLWRRVLVAPPNTEDMQCIVEAWYPSLKPVAEKIVATLQSVKNSIAQQLMGFQSRGLSHVANKFSLRDILKMCKRIVSLSFTKDNLSEQECLCIYREAIDVFAAFNTSTETRLSIMKCIAQLWGLHVSVSESLYPVHKPVMQELLSEFRIGRIFLERSQMKSRVQRKPFVEIRSSLHTLERIASSVKFNEPILLVGETGTGKTTLVQNLASLLGQKLTVLNLSQQTDVSDLLGGFMPVDAQFICFPLYEEFKNLFSRTFSSDEQNEKYLSSTQQHRDNNNWGMLLKRFQGGIDAYEKFKRPGRKRKRSLDAQLHKDWRKFIQKHRAAVGQIRASSSAMLFSFVEGAFVSAMRNGEWIFARDLNVLSKPLMLISTRLLGVVIANKVRDVQDAELLIASSSHKVLISLMEFFIKPLLRDLFLQTLSTDFISRLGSAWLRIGGMRFHLLLGIGDRDPVMKYSYKYSQLAKKISLVELEIKVREECDYLAGVFSTRQEDRTNRLNLENLNAERKQLQRKIVFRPDPAKFKKLRYECNAFLQYVTGVVTKNGGLDMHGLHNWQERATSFINRLSEEYGTYCDITQPIQVAVFEMKLGLSLIQSSALQSKILNGVLDDMNTVMEAVYSFMRFPTRCCSFRSEILPNNQQELFSFDISFQGLELTKDMELIQKLAKVTRGASMSNMVSLVHLEASIYQSFLQCVVRCVSHSQLLDKDLFMLLDRIFDQFASHWLDMKTLERNREDNDARQYKFRPRAFTIENIFEFDVSSPGSSTTSGVFQEWYEFLSEGGYSERKEDSEDQAKLAEERNLIPDCILQKLVQAHDQLFGSIDLVQKPGTMHVSAEDRLMSFVNSYSVGVDIIRGLDGFSVSCLDAKIIPEHLLRLCLEHEEKINYSQRSTCSFNFYKDSNAPAMAKMVPLLMSLRERIFMLLSEWEEHPGLQKVLEIIDMLLAIPLSTSLAKALSGLQFLLARAQMLQENGSKFQLSEKLQPLIALVSSWKKIEFDSWPSLLDEVQDQCEINARKLWFPLYSVLQHRHSSDITGCHQSIVESLEEFIQTSSIGEFKRRLHLLLAFHGQISSGICLGTYSSSCHENMLKILYNLFGYYMQFLPIISEHLEASRKSVEEDLSKLLKLCRWEHPESYISIENSKSARQKVKKLVQKYTDLLQQPVMLILTHEEARRGVEKEMSETLRAPTSSTRKDGGRSTGVKFEMAPFSENRCMWYAGWRKKVGQYCLDNLHVGRTSESISYFMGCQEAKVNECVFYINGWRGAWDALEEISSTALHCGDLWKDPKTTFGKRGALTLKQLLQLLNNSGLSKHKPMLSEFSRNHLDSNETSWCLQPAYEVQHLLLTHPALLCGSPDLIAQEEFLALTIDSMGKEWQLATHFHFKSMASVELLKKVSLKHHKQFTLDQVKATVSYLNHLITIQQEQRKAAYGFADQVTYFKNYLSLLENLYSMLNSDGDDRNRCNCCIISNQPKILDLLWKQKEVFDSLSAAFYDSTLLLKTLDATHLQSCQSVKFEAIGLLNIIEELMPICQNSKESLDNILIRQDRGGIKLVVDFQHLSAIPQKMEQLLLKNFEVLVDFEKRLSTLHEQEAIDRRSVEVTMVSHLEDIIKKGKEMEKALEKRIESDSSGESYPELEAAYNQSLERIEKQIMSTCQALHSSKKFSFLLEKGNQIPSWTAFFETFVRILRLDQLCNELRSTIYHVGKFVNHPACGRWETSLSLDVGMNLRHLHESLDLILRFCYGLLQDFLAMHKTVAMLSHTLADLFSSLYSKGFGSQEDQEEDKSCDGEQEASGTGMGEGTGAKDVSDQISDEDQLLGAQKENEDQDQDASNEIPAQNDKGIEMEEDFTAETFSVSEDESGDEDGKENEENELDSAMGETGDDSAVTDAKLWDKNEDEDPSDRTQEKYDAGPSVEDKDDKSRELRAREDSGVGNGDDDQGEDPDNPDKLTERDSQIDQETNNQEDGKTMDDTDADLSKEDDLADPSGLAGDDQNQSCEDVDMHKDDDASPGEDDANHSEEDLDPADLGKSPENQHDEEDENIDLEDTIEEGEREHDKDEDSQMDLEAQKNSDTMDPTNGNMQTTGYSFNTEEMTWSNSSDVYNDVTPVRGLPSGAASEVEITMEDSLGGSQLTGNQPESRFPPRDSTVPQKILPNPCRNAGDALQDWKERVKVSIDLAENNAKEAPDDDNMAMDEDAANEFGYVSQFEKGTAQALGAATSDQIDKNINDIRPDTDDGHPPIEENDLFDRMEIDEEKPMAKPVPRHSSFAPETKLEEQLSVSNLKKLNEGYAEQLGYSDHEFKTLSESLVSIKKSFMNEEIHQLRELSLTDAEFGKAEAHDMYISSDSATSLWRSYELLTSRMSQELTEQLRLVMEPTLASKLQGDYKTGKRINMKKVIPYIASHYRKDKIWLRRTRPNKRNYQVVIAVDDSRSMSESNCGNVAIEALVTVCRSMSQLEVGDLAVASFGKKGNIRLLHDFGQPFTGEAGLKIISSLTFKQENTIADEPVVDLLKYLNNMLDDAVANARLPSGHNPLQQLVLIIADGRFHEKEKLKRCVRDVMSGKRLVAFLLLDNSPQDSIMDVLEASYMKDGSMKLSKYLDSFPFPYYIVLRNIESLPRTLADLLRQWFELMQYSSN